MQKVPSERASTGRASSGRAERRLLDLFSSIWFGVFLAAMLFVYCSIGSAVPQLRQLPALEMTEFEWFHWWPFSVVVILLCLTLTVVTVRRIPLRLVNAGVWMIHTGIIILVVGSYYYFGTKVEGDAPVFRRQVQIEIPGMPRPQTLVVLPGNESSVIVGPDQWRFQIQSTDSAWPILSDEHKGETAYAVNLAVTPPDGERFIRQILAGYPQYTEDIIPGKGRAIKSIGRKLVKEDLKITLEYEPTEYFHVMDTWALFVRRTGETEWIERPIRELPRYNDYFSSREQVFTDPRFPTPLRTLDLEIAEVAKPDALSGASVRVTGYLRYAHLQRRWRDGGDRLNPVLRFSLLPDDGQAQSHELVAFDRAHSHAERGSVQFSWLDDPSLVDSLPTGMQAMLHVTVPGTDVEFDVPITPETVVGDTGPFVVIEGTDFSYRLLNVHDNLVMPRTGSAVSVAMVEIKTPEDRFTRMVADQPEMTRDIRDGDADPHSSTGRTPEKADLRIHMTYQPQSAPLLLVAHPDGMYMCYNGESERILGRETHIGESVEIIPGLLVRVDALWTHAVASSKPYIVPPPSRRRNMRESLAMIQLEVDTGNGIETKWLEFNQYVFPDEGYAYSGRFAYTPRRFRLSDGKLVEVVFSRERRKLPNAIALDTFALDTHVGGYTGSASTIRNYLSRLRFRDAGRWSEPATIRVNAPTEYGGYWYFQSTWDKPTSKDPRGGMNYTGLGIGNRNGVYIQLAGCSISIVGMLFAFYAKPLLKRRRRAESRAKLSQSEELDEEVSADASTGETIRV